MVGEHAFLAAGSLCCQHGVRKAIVALLEQPSSERFHVLVRNGLEVVHKKTAKETVYYIPCGWLVLEKASVDSSVVYGARKSYFWDTMATFCGLCCGMLHAPARGERGWPGRHAGACCRRPHAAACCVRPRVGSAGGRGRMLGHAAGARTWGARRSDDRPASAKKNRNTN